MTAPGPRPRSVRLLRLLAILAITPITALAIRHTAAIASDAPDDVPNRPLAVVLDDGPTERLVADTLRDHHIPCGGQGDLGFVEFDVAATDWDTAEQVLLKLQIPPDRIWLFPDPDHKPGKPMQLPTKP